MAKSKQGTVDGVNWSYIAPEDEPDFDARLRGDLSSRQQDMVNIVREGDTLRVRGHAEPRKVTGFSRSFHDEPMVELTPPGVDEHDINYGMSRYYASEIDPRSYERLKEQRHDEEHKSLAHVKAMLINQSKQIKRLAREIKSMLVNMNRSKHA
jgi:hypothetical protein